MSHFTGVLPGIVKSLKDPDGLGRIQVHFPTKGGENRSFWAAVAAPMAGRQRGFFFHPELEDEVLVAFQDGGPQHPYILGFLWNGQDIPPESKPDNRVIVTPGGHTVRFDILATSTAFSAGTKSSTLEEKALRVISAEQKIVGPLSLTGSVSETPTGIFDKTLKAGFKKTW